MFKKLNLFRSLFLAIALIIAMSLCSCVDTGTSDDDTSEALPSISFFRISGASEIEIGEGTEHQLVIDHPAEILAHVQWTVEGSSVTVDKNGKLTAVSLGTSTVTATYGQLSDSVKVTVVESSDVGGDDTGSGGTGENASTVISNILNGTNDETYTVRGTVVAFNAQSFLIKDSTGSVLVYMGYTWSPDVKIGDVVEVTGKRAEYGLAPQFATGSVYEKISGGSFTQPTPAEPTAAELNAYSTMSKVTPNYVKLTGVLSLSSDGKYYNFNISGATIIGSLTYPKASDVIALKNMNGSTLEVEGYITGVTSAGKYLNLIIVNYTEIESGTSGDGSGSGSGTGSGSGGGSGSTSTSGVVINGEEIPAYSGNGYYIVNGNVPFFTATDKAFTGYKYSPLDSLGRATGAFARLTASLCPTDDRDSISHIRPTGWNYNKSYSVTNGQVLYNRSHLLAHSLMSDDVHPENFVSGTMYMNQTVMTTFEDLVRGFVKGGSDVLYRVTPIYLGNNLVCNGLLIEAFSIEDGGDDVCFCVYLYNVQPGIEIDYSTGENWLAGSGSGSGSGTGSGSGGGSVTNPGDAVNGDVIFNFGSNGSASHVDGSPKTEASFTEGSYTLTLKSGVQLYTGAYDNTGNSCLKLGASSKVGSFSFEVGSNVTKVYIKVAGYKTSNGNLVVNGTTTIITTHSNDGAYTVIEVDTSADKLVTVSTASGGYRVMIDSIEFGVG